MEFSVSELIDASFDQIVHALQDPAYYQHLALTASTAVQAPELLGATTADGVLDLSVRYAFAGEISGAAAMAVDAAKLTWVIHTTLNLAQGQGSIVVHPDHYGDLLTCEATVEFAEHEDGTTESFSGALTVHVPLFGSTVEQAILRGLEAHLASEASALSTFIQ
jgi:hypothetical protein